MRAIFNEQKSIVYRSQLSKPLNSSLISLASEAVISDRRCLLPAHLNTMALMMFTNKVYSTV